MGICPECGRSGDHDYDCPRYWESGDHEIAGAKWKKQLAKFLSSYDFAKSYDSEHTSELYVFTSTASFKVFLSYTEASAVLKLLKLGCDENGEKIARSCTNHATEKGPSAISNSAWSDRGQVRDGHSLGWSPTND